MKTYQLIVIGAGPGGYTAALRAAKLGLRVAVVERREVGGTCLNRGCVPTKALLHASQIYYDACNSAAAGILVDGAQVDLQAVFANKRQICEKLGSGVEGLLQNAKVDLIRGSAVITASGAVTITALDGENTVYAADNILIATGSIPARPPIPGLDLPGVMTSDELLEGEDRLYRSIIIIGGGVIGVEFAVFYSNLGCEVTVIEGMERLLPMMDRELGQNLSQLLKKRGVRVVTGAMVQEIRQNGAMLDVHFSAKDTAQVVTAERVLCAIGRRPYLEGLFAGGLQPAQSGPALWVDERFQTSIPGVYAIGDVSSRIQLAHVASAQGIACVDMMCGKTSSVNLDVVPSCVYCHPEIAAVGVTEAQAKEANIPVKVGKCVMGGNARTLIADPGRSFMKFVANSDTHEIIGAQLMCEHSTDMISQVSMAIANHFTVEQMLLAMRPHPTFEEAMGEALEDLQRKLCC